MDPALPEDRPVAAIFRSPLFNASETFVRRHARGLRRYRPLYVGLHDRGDAGAAILPAGRSERLALALFGRADRFAERLAAERPSLVHAHFGTDGLLALPLAERLGIPLVTTLHGHEISRRPTRMLLSGRLSWTRYALLKRRLFARGRLFLAVSEALRRQAIAVGYPADRTIVHYSGVDIHRFRRDGAAEPGLVLHVGRLVEKKGTAILLDAFALVKEAVPGARLVIIGDGPLRASLAARPQEIGLGASVRFLGSLGEAEVLAWMQRAWLLAAPSVRARDGDCEGLPTVICEAAAAGLPAVATLHSGIPEAVIDGATGFLVPERDRALLAARIIELLGDGDLRETLAGAARALAEERFDASRQIALLEDHYDALIEAGAESGQRIG